MRRHLITPASLVAALLALLSAPASAQASANWTPQDFESMRLAIVRWANASLKPILALTVRPDYFREDIGDGSVVYLDPESRSETTPTDAGQAVLTSVSIDRYYFRERLTEMGDSYRHVRTRYEMDCAGGTIRPAASTLYRFPPEAQLVVIGRLADPEGAPEAPDPGTLGHVVFKAVCEGETMYTPG